MLSDLRSLKTCAAVCCVIALTAGAEAAVINKEGIEHRILLSLPGAQMNPQLSFNSNGGYLITQDNTVDGTGLGIRVRKYYADFSGARGTMLANTTIKGDQRDGKVALLGNGGAVITWLTPHATGAKVAVRFLGPTGVFAGPETFVSSETAWAHYDPAVAVLKDDSVVIAWTSMDQDGHMQGIYAQRFSNTGLKLGNEIKVAQTSLFNQRSAAVSGLSNGNFVVTWVSEHQRSPNSFDVYGRIFTSVGAPVGGEFRITTSDNVCANPVIGSLQDNGFVVAWSERKFNPGPDGWDIRVRTFDLSGQPQLHEQTVNQKIRGDQYVPGLATLNGKIFLIWTSMGQDGFDEGVFGRVMDYAGVFETAEFQINTTTLSKQVQPTITSDGIDTFVVAWSSFTGMAASYDLFAQRYTLNVAATLPAPIPPFLAALSQKKIAVTWPDFLGENVEHYEIFVDGSTTPIKTTEMYLLVENANWAPGSQHQVTMSYTLKDGRRSPASEASVVTTWGTDSNADGLPDDWQRIYWGVQGNWSMAFADPDEDGATNFQEFLAGTNPLDRTSVLETKLSSREQGIYLEWNTQPGSVYQVQVSTDLNVWADFGAVRFAPSSQDAIPAGAAGSYYRVIRLR